MAATTAPTNSTFPHFSALPPELRNQIWHDALPEKDRPALYPYRKGCWQTRRLSKSDEGYDIDDKYNLHLEFCHTLLYVQVEVPLFFVNREARGVALVWVREQGIEMRFCEGRCHVFMRPFDPLRDALYIALDKVYDFCFEPYDRLDQSDLLGEGQTAGIDPDLTRIAVPEALLWTESDILPSIFQLFSRAAVLFIVIDAQPDFKVYQR